MHTVAVLVNQLSCFVTCWYLSLSSSFLMSDVSALSISTTVDDIKESLTVIPVISCFSSLKPWNEINKRLSRDIIVTLT